MRRLLLSLAFIPIMVHEGVPVMCYRGVVKAAPKVDPKQEKCLATAIYGEARREAEIGQIAMAFTALNRAVNKTICGVVLAPRQYSIFNDNPALKAAAMSPHLEPRQKNIIDKASWEQAKHVARMVLTGSISDPTMGSTHYLADKVMRQKGYIYPRWSKEYIQVAVIGGHRLFKINAKSTINKA